ncbi:DNA polymerase III subunit beta [Acidithiobacillus sp. MC6.1]|nr:DNA polymerase III subunit beta [Acidithiobacillus sp. MC6.1]
MRIRCTREELYPVLSELAALVEARPVIPILGDILFEPEEDGGTWQMIASDMETELRSRMPFRITDTEAFTLPAKKLLDICKELPADAAIEIDIKSGRATIKSTRSRFTLHGSDASDFPKMKTMNDPNCSAVVEAEAFLEALKVCGAGMASKDSRMYLNGVALQCIPDGTVEMVGMNGHRLHRARITGEIIVSPERLCPQIIVPRNAVLKLIRWLDRGSVRIAMDDRCLVVETEKGAMSTQLIDAAYPDVERMIPKALDYRLRFSKADLEASLNLSDTLNDDDEKRTRLQISREGMQVHSQNTENETAEIVIPVEYPYSDGLRINLNSRYLLDMLKGITQKDVVMEFSDARGGVVFHDPDSMETLFVIMPIRSK